MDYSILCMYFLMLNLFIKIQLPGAYEYVDLILLFDGNLFHIEGIYMASHRYVYVCAKKRQ